VWLGRWRKDVHIELLVEYGQVSLRSGGEQFGSQRVEYPVVAGGRDRTGYGVAEASSG